VESGLNIGLMANYKPLLCSGKKGKGRNHGAHGWKTPEKLKRRIFIDGCDVL
jgi:hypothetical protein